MKLEKIGGEICFETARRQEEAIQSLLGILQPETEITFRRI